MNLRKMLGLPERVTPLAKALKALEADLMKLAVEHPMDSFNEEARARARYDMIAMHPLRLIEELIRRGA